MVFDSSSWIDRLQSDEALTGNLDDSQAERLLGWGEGALDACRTDAEAEAVIAAIREVDRRVGDGEPFEGLFPPAVSEIAPRPGPGIGDAVSEPTPSDDRSPQVSSDSSGEGPDGSPSTGNNQPPSATA